MTHCMIVSHRMANLQVLQATVDRRVLLNGNLNPIPALKDIPAGATQEQIKCATAAGVVYLNDVIDCIQLPTPSQVNLCVSAAFSLYCASFGECFPA